MMSKKLRNIVCGFLSCLILFTSTVVSFANDYENVDNEFISEDQFNELKKEGIYGDEVNYNDFINSIKMYEQENGENNLRQARAAYTPKKGDIVTTGASNTASSGIIGHAGIFIDNSTILHISGSNTSYTSTMSWSKWKSTYKSKNMVFRVPNSTIASKAADWVKNNYLGKKPGYKITSNWRSTSPTYCSKIVWQGYYFGTGSAPVLKAPVEPFYIQPRTIASYFNKSYAPALVFSN